MPSANREKDRIRHPKCHRYLTRVGKVAILESAVGNLAIQMATFGARFVNIGGKDVNMKSGMSP
jgi:hypothetical protein